MKVNSSGLLGMGPALQSPMDASDATFTLPGCVFASSAEDSGHAGGLMGTDVCVDVFKTQTESRQGRCTGSDVGGL